MIQLLQNQLYLSWLKKKLNIKTKALYGGKIFFYNSVHDLWFNGGFINKKLGIAKHFNSKKNRQQFKIINSNVFETTFITFCFVLIPKIAFFEIGLLNEKYFMYVEDWDYCYKALEKGYKLYFIDDVIIYHKVGRSSGNSKSEFSVYYTMRNRILFIFENLSFFNKITAILYLIVSRFIKFFSQIKKRNL